MKLTALNFKRLAEGVILFCMAYKYAKESGLLDEGKKLAKNLQQKASNTARTVANKLDTNPNSYN